MRHALSLSSARVRCPGLPARARARGRVGQQIVGYRLYRGTNQKEEESKSTRHTYRLFTCHESISHGLSHAQTCHTCPARTRTRGYCTDTPLARYCTILHGHADTAHADTAHMDTTHSHIGDAPHVGAWRTRRRGTWLCAPEKTFASREQWIRRRIAELATPRRRVAVLQAPGRRQSLLRAR